MMHSQKLMTFLCCTVSASRRGLRIVEGDFLHLRDQTVQISPCLFSVRPIKMVKVKLPVLHFHMGKYKFSPLQKNHAASLVALPDSSLFIHLANRLEDRMAPDTTVRC